MTHPRYLKPAVACLVVGILALPWGTSAPASTAGWRGFSLPQRGLRGAVPARWQVSGRDLLPKLIDPHEVLAIGTGPLPVGRGGNCGAYPIKALAAMGPRGALISVLQYTGFRSTRRPPGPQRQPLGLSSLGDLRLVPTSGRVGNHPRYLSTSVNFADHGRSFVATVASAQPASLALRRRLLRILDSLRAA